MLQTCQLLIVFIEMFVTKAMQNRNYVKRPRARRFKSPQSNKKTNLVGEIFVNNFDVPGFRKI